MKPKDDFKFFRGMGYIEDEDHPKTEEEWELFHKRLIAGNRARIRVATRRALFSSAILILVFIGFFLMDEGMPFREWAPIAAPVLWLVLGIPASALTIIFWTYAIGARLLGLNRPDGVTRR